jgi:alanine-glyoxylate transaminase / serine-glyoxylate transaminase / serine-pyruvate transaminase
MAAMGAPILGHLDPEFLDVMETARTLLRYVFQTTNRLTFPVSGTGSAAMETSVAALVERGDSVLVCVNGYFGGRIAEMARRHGGRVATLERPWGDVFEADEVRDALRRRPAGVVAIVHGETSTGVLQPLDEISHVVHDEGALLIVDAVTTLAGVPVRVDETDIDVCYSAAQKCLGAPPGLGPVSIGPRAEKTVAGRLTPVDTWYFDPQMLGRYWGTERAYHHTAPISLHFALYEALRMVAEEGLEARWERHRRNAESLWSGLEQLGLELAVPRDRRLPMLTTVRVPDGVDDAAIRRGLLADYGIEIGSGLGEQAGRIWRIGLMGASSCESNVALLVHALGRLLGRDLGARAAVPVGDGR